MHLGASVCPSVCSSVCIRALLSRGARVSFDLRLRFCDDCLLFLTPGGVGGLFLEPFWKTVPLWRVEWFFFHLWAIFFSFFPPLKVAPKIIVPWVELSYFKNRSTIKTRMSKSKVVHLLFRTCAAYWYRIHIKGPERSIWDFGIPRKKIGILGFYQVWNWDFRNLVWNWDFRFHQDPKLGFPNPKHTLKQPLIPAWSNLMIWILGFHHVWNWDFGIAGPSLSGPYIKR